MTEYEKQVLDIDEVAMRKKLKSIGCKKIHDAKMFRRNVFHLSNKDANGFARVRDEGSHVSMTTKIQRPNKKYPDESEITVNADFEKASDFMESTGLEQKSYQETIREKYSHPLAHEITIDHVPGLPTYMEIDCTSEENLNKLIKLLDIDNSKTTVGSFDKQFASYYDIPKDEFLKIKKLTFRNVRNQVFPKKNKELFAKVVEAYKESYLKKTQRPFKKTAKKRCINGTRKKCVPKRAE
jgi:adenylate cyclase class IV